MARRKAQASDLYGDEDTLLRRKRSRQDFDDDELANAATDTPSKRRRRSTLKASATNGHDDDYDIEPGLNQSEEESEEQPRPTPRKRGRPPKAAGANGAASTPTKRTPTKKLATPSVKTVTPIKQTGANGVTPRRKQAWDRSARRKSARALIERVVGDDVSDQDDEEGALVRAIYESSEDDDDDDDDAVAEAQASEDEATEEPTSAPATPSKTPKKRGRPRKTRSPTPPRDLPGHEMYFLQNKPGRPKTSNNSLASLELLTHEEYFSILRKLDDPHAEDIEFLQGLHAQSFPQWSFELSQGFSLCLFGFGSKRRVLLDFANHVYARSKDHERDRIVVINGYVRTITVREIIASVFAAIHPGQKLTLAQPAAMMHTLGAELAKSGKSLTLIVNSVDAMPLRKPGVQAVMAGLAALPRVHFVCSADTPDFSLLWDSGLRSAFSFVFHDCTTFAPLDVELEVVDDVHELLGRKAHRAGGREGVAFVLRSLTQNAKDLYRLLVGEVLVALDDEGSASAAAGDVGIEYKMLYNKAVEEFICSSEMNFRGLLKEFHDHQMVVSRKDAIGTEMLSVPFRREELEGILEDLMS